MVRTVVEAADQSVAALFLPARLRSLRDAVADLSDRVSRRYFALLPTARTVGIEASPAIDAWGRVIYRVRHVTRYDYQTPVDLGAHLAHLRPRSLPHQRVLRAGVHAAPAVSWRRDGSDHFGNEVTWLFLDVAHAAFQVIADATVDVAFPAPPHRVATPAWETVAKHAHGLRRFARAEVITAGVQHNHAGRIRDHDPIGEMQHVGQVRAAEAAVDHVMFGKIIRDVGPAARVRTARRAAPRPWPAAARRQLPRTS